MNAWWLVLIVPASVWVGSFVTAGLATKAYWKGYDVGVRDGRRDR